MVNNPPKNLPIASLHEEKPEEKAALSPPEGTKPPPAPMGPRGPLREPPPVPPVSPTAPALEGAETAEDMFAGLERTAPTGVPGEIEKPAVAEAPREGLKRILFFAGLAVVGVAVLGGTGYFIYTKFQPKKERIEIGPVVVPIEEAAPEVIVPIEEAAPAPPIELVIIDSDNDGLSNDEEAELGTDPNNPDTDSDELFDGEEVKVYGTDPLNPDTDGDTYLDGIEVSRGYDPKGLGKLLQIPPP